MQKRTQQQLPRRIYFRRQVTIVVIVALVATIAVAMIAPQPEDFKSLPDLRGDAFFEARLYGLSEEGAELYARQNALTVVQFARQHPQFHVDNRWWEDYGEPARSHYEACFQGFVPEWTKQEAQR